MDKIIQKLDKIDNIIDSNKYHLFRNNKNILSANTFKLLKEDLKHFEEPSKNLKLYLIQFNIDSKYKYPLIINCTQNTLTPKLNLVVNEEDMTIAVTYTSDELLKYGFKKNHIYKIINAMKDDKISYRKPNVSISNILKLYE